MSCCCSVARSPLRAKSDHNPAPKSAPPARAKRSTDNPRAPARITSNGISALRLLLLVFFELLFRRGAAGDALQQPDKRRREEHVERREPEEGGSYPRGQGKAFVYPHDPLRDPGLAALFGCPPTQLNSEEAQETGEDYRGEEEPYPAHRVVGPPDHAGVWPLVLWELVEAKDSSVGIVIGEDREEFGDRDVVAHLPGFDVGIAADRERRPFFRLEERLYGCKLGGLVLCELSGSVVAGEDHERRR